MSAYPQSPPYPPAGGQSMPSAPPPYAQAPAGAPPVVYGHTPQRVVCTECGAEGVTDVRLESSPVAWLMCMLLCLTGLMFVIPLFLCWLPFCLDACRDTAHRCSGCGALLGKRTALGLNMKPRRPRSYITRNY